MRYFIFLTSDGSTNTATDINIDNLQVLGWSDGDDEQEAFNNLLKENEHLSKYDYENISAMELKNNKQYYLR